MIPVDTLIDDFAHRSFFEIADADYVAARMAYRLGFITQFLWASQQAIEKYLKHILLINRIPATRVRHDLEKALSMIEGSGKLTLHLTEGTKGFITKLSEIGQYRYFEVPNLLLGWDIISLDRAVWELRRYCTLNTRPRQFALQEGIPAPRVRIDGGFLESVLDKKGHLAREALLWQNGCFGRSRKSVKILSGFKSQNAPLFLHPQILEEVLKYIFLPESVVKAYRRHRESSAT